MSAGSPASGGLPPLRVEKALGLLPDLESVAPLRALLLSISRPDEGALWSSSGPYLTLGKRGVQAEELERRMPEAFREVTEHLQALYGACIEALEAQQRGDGEAVAEALLKAGRFEQRAGRQVQARTWYEAALRVAESLQDRRPEIEVLRSLGALSLDLGLHADAARHFQRALALSEAEFDQAGAIASCAGLGEAALEQGQWPGAHAWFARGRRLAEASREQRSLGRMERHLGVLAQRQGNLKDASEHLRRARELLESAGAAEELARALSAQGDLEAQLGRYSVALAAHREALAWAQRESRNVVLELTIRLSIAHLHLEAGRLLEADEELRRSEEEAIAGNHTTQLIDIYTLMGRLRGRQADETGFVFFEQAIELCRSLKASPMSEARVYLEYGRFRSLLDQPEEARAYFERSRALFASLGESLQRDRAEAELQKVSA